MKVKIALAQITTKLGDVSANLEKHLRLTSQAQAAGADLIVFPECGAQGLCR
jgi:predicted amidohydrolase